MPKSEAVKGPVDDDSKFSEITGDESQIDSTPEPPGEAPVKGEGA